MWEEIKKSRKFLNTSIATGYFARLKKYSELNYTPIAICGKSPFWYKRLEYKKLAPKINFFLDYKNGKINENDYVRCFYEQVLSELDPRKVMVELMEKSDGRNIVLLCYEKPFDFCHRHIVSHWLTNQMGQEIQEVNYEN